MVLKDRKYIVKVIEVSFFLLVIILNVNGLKCLIRR